MFGDFFKKAKNAAIQKLLEKQLASLPKAQQSMIMKLISDNPALFEKMGKEIEEKVKSGTNQLYAAKQVFKKYEGGIAKVMQN